jgi:soluble lytic murein transglycosylase-like protein
MAAYRFAILFSCVMALAPAGARADVLELGPDGARWIAGPQATPLSEPLRAADTGGLPLVDGIEFPEGAVVALERSSAALPDRYENAVRHLAARFDLSPALIEALVWQESRWRENAVSPVGARGLAQLMPGTARDLGVNPDDPLANLEGGARYLRQQLDRFDGDVEKALAAYNAGPGRVEKAGGIPRIRETQVYVAAVMGRLSDHSRSEN